MASAQAGWEAAKNVWTDPQGLMGLSSRSDFYDRLQAYYTNTAYQEWGKIGLQWETLRSKKGFYRYHRTILNPTFRLVKFYRDSIYTGALTSDGEKQSNGAMRAIPFGESTPKHLKLALAQVEEWSGWQHNMIRLTTNTPKLGNMLAEVVDIPWQGKVVIRLWKPHHIKEIELDDAGNPKYVCIELQMTERKAGTEDTRTFIYRREMDGLSVRTFRDGKPYDYSNGVQGHTWQHPYGFLPCRWFRHMVDDLDSDYGLPAIYPAIDKIDELNELVSQGHDQLSKIFNSPLIVKGGRQPSTEEKPKRGSTLQTDRPTTNRTDKEKINYVYVGADGGAETLSLPMGEALEWVQNLYLDIEADLPELGFPRRLAEMSSITGPAATRVLRDVVDAHLSVQANYDHDMRRLYQMAVAIAGYNVKSGIWAYYQKQQTGSSDLTVQQQRFAGYDLDSYKAGNLDFEILSRPLLLETNLEKWTARTAQAAAVDIEVNKLGVPHTQGWENLDYPDDEITAWEAQRLQDQQAAQDNALAVAQAQGQAQQPGQGAASSAAGSGGKQGTPAAKKAAASSPAANPPAPAQPNLGVNK